MEVEHISLVKKLAEVMAAVDRVAKRGRNDFHRYDYATEADIAAAIRQELASRSVLLVPAITGESRVPVGEKGEVLTTLDMEFTFYDGDSQEQITRPWKGYGTDKGDKGGYKAMTGGEKYLLLKTFLIPTGDDPEQDDKKPGATGYTVEAPKAPRGTETTRPVATATGPAAGSGGGNPAPLTHEEMREAVQAGYDKPQPLTILSVGKAATKNPNVFKYTVVLSDGRRPTTINEQKAKVAEARCQDGAVVEVDTKETKYGLDLVNISTVPSEEPAQQGQMLTDDDIPF